MGDSFQDYSRIQEFVVDYTKFKADFLKLRDRFVVFLMIYIYFQII